MSYKLRVDQSLGKNLGRIFCQEVGATLAVAKGVDEPNDTRVHAMRKHLKKARAILQLVRKKIGKAFRREDRRLRDVGRLMTEIRDAEVRLQTMRQLEDAMHHHYLSYQKIERLLALELENFLVASGDWRNSAIPMLERACEEAEQWPIDDYRSKQLRHAIEHTYKSGRSALAALKAKPSARKFHELRKQVKLLDYQLRILRPLNHVVIGSVSGELTDLGHLLGRIHDLNFLADRLRRERSEKHWGKQDDALLTVIENCEAELQRDGMEMAERFFAERKSEFGCLILEWFEDWHHAKTGSVAEALVAAN
jgi:CHAD domain-containing protein